MSASSLPEVLNVIEVAALLLCEPDTVEEKTRRRELPAVRFGRSWVYPREALMQVLNKLALMQIEPASAARVSPVVTPMRMTAPPGDKSSRGLRRSPPPLPVPPSQRELSRGR